MASFSRCLPFSFVDTAATQRTSSMPEAPDFRFPAPPLLSWRSAGRWNNNWKSMTVAAVQNHTAISHPGVHRVAASNAALGKCMSSRHIHLVDGLLHHARLPDRNRPTLALLCWRVCAVIATACFLHLPILDIGRKSRAEADFTLLLWGIWRPRR